MLPSLTYRTADFTRWGGGNGSDLSATQIDLNFWQVAQAILTLQSSQTLTVSIDYITQVSGGNQFYIVLTDHQVLGPFYIPTAQWTPRGEWQPFTAYAPFDTVSYNGALYLVMQTVVSAATFSPLATQDDAAVYVLILSAPADAVPAEGVAGQKLVFTGGSPAFSAWQNDYIRLALFIPGTISSGGSILLQYGVVDNMTLPVGLEGSVAYAATETLTTVSYPIFQNGNPIGSIIFVGPSPDSIEVEFPAAVNFVPGDILVIKAPAAPDSNQANISITLLATLT